MADKLSNLLPLSADRYSKKQKDFGTELANVMMFNYSDDDLATVLTSDPDPQT